MTGVTQPPPAAGVAGRVNLTAVTRLVRPLSLPVAEWVRFERRVNAHQGPNRGLPAIRAAKPPRCPTTTRCIIRYAGLAARRGRGVIEVREISAEPVRLAFNGSAGTRSDRGGR